MQVKDVNYGKTVRKSYAKYQEILQITSNVESSLIIAISQSGETEAIINDVREAESKGFSAICFTRRSDSKLARMSDLTFLVDASNQTLISAVPNQFFGKVILAFEELMGRLFR